MFNSPNSTFPDSRITLITFWKCNFPWAYATSGSLIDYWNSSNLQHGKCFKMNQETEYDYNCIDPTEVCFVNITAYTQYLSTNNLVSFLLYCRIFLALKTFFFLFSLNFRPRDICYLALSIASQHWPNVYNWRQKKNDTQQYNSAFFATLRSKLLRNRPTVWSKTFAGKFILKLKTNAEKLQSRKIDHKFFYN